MSKGGPVGELFYTNIEAEDGYRARRNIFGAVPRNANLDYGLVAEYQSQIRDLRRRLDDQGLGKKARAEIRGAITRLETLLPSE